MEQQQAVRILNALANGVHPATGEVFSADSPYQHPDTVRALFEAMRAMNSGSLKPSITQTRKAVETPANTFVRWTAEEEARLASGFDSGKTSSTLAKLHNRSRAAIEARLLKLGKIDVSALTVRLRYLPKTAEGTNTPLG